MVFTYIRRELRRRRKQAIVVAAGLALGIGLVVTVSAMADGVRGAQSRALRSLYGVGTDATVTTRPRFGRDGGARFDLNPSGGERGGDAFARDRVLLDPGLGTMSDEDVRTVASIDGVAEAAGGLSLNSIRLEGTFAQPNDGGGPSVQVAGPGMEPVDVSTIDVAGVDVAHPDLGALTSSQVTRGRWFETDEAHARVAIVSRGYAREHELELGSTFRIGGQRFEVIGLSKGTSSADAVDVAMPLGRARSLAGLEDDAVNRIWVKAEGASAIARMKAGIEEALPRATVTTADELASQVTGSLAAASDLAGSLGRWLSLAALVAAFAVASLLTLSAVGRRVREFGTLKALGWRSRRVVTQVLGESLAIGVLGGALGIAVGFLGTWLVNALFPSLEATTGPGGVGGPGGLVVAGGSGGGGPVDALTNTIHVPLDASVSLTLVALAIGLAVLGGLVAGSFGGWRAARLRPAEALRRVE